MAALMDSPAAWRAKAETDRLVRAKEPRELVSSRCRAADDPALQTRTLQSLVDGIEEDRSAVA